MKKELVKEAFDYGYTSYHECNTDLDYEQHLEDCYVSILDSEYENNNGWIKLESEDDFPEDNVTCWIIDKNLGIVSGKWINAPTEKQQVEAKNYWLENATHYQVIEEPLKPIY